VVAQAVVDLHSDGARAEDNGTADQLAARSEPAQDGVPDGNATHGERRIHDGRHDRTHPDRNTRHGQARHGEAGCGRQRTDHNAAHDKHAQVVEGGGTEPVPPVPIGQFGGHRTRDECQTTRVAPPAIATASTAASE
jgi:hypothetical protein